jgi:DNA-binding GntR family transcriptional regulator
MNDTREAGSMADAVVEHSASARDLPRPNRSILADGTYEAVKTLVMNHVIPPGERVSIDALARDLQVSHTPVREALARLEADGLVVKEPLRGYRTTPLLTRRQFNELFDMRLLIEGWAVKQAASTMTPTGRRRLREEMATCAAAPAGSDYETYKSIADHDARFHDLIFELTGNETVRAMWARTHCHLHLFRLFYASGLGDRTLKEHRAIASALAAGDAQAAEAAMLAHIEASRARLLPATVDA